MKLYGFFRSLATYRVKVALALKGVPFDEVAVDIFGGGQHDPAYLKLNPQAVVPALLPEDGGPPLFQSMAILEYLEEAYPVPALLPVDPRGRARVRGLALIAVADGHPLVTPRVRGYLEKEFGASEEDRTRWSAHWTLKSLQAIEAHLAEAATGRFCHGDGVTLADIGLASQCVAATAYFKCDTASVPNAMRVYGECMKLPAFSRAHPMNQAAAAPPVR